MAVVLIGPSCVGKSTSLQADNRDQYIDRQYTDVIFGHELRKKPITVTSIIHYNMLRQSRYWRHILLPNAWRWQLINQHWDFHKEPIFTKIFQSGKVEHCIVLVAPIHELIERIKNRTITEAHNPTKYPAHFWYQATTHLYLHCIYGQLFDILDQRAVPCTVYFSSKPVNGFAPTNRDQVATNLKGVFIPTC